MVVDSAITSLNERFQNLGEARDKFGVLFQLKEMSFDALTTVSGAERHRATVESRTFMERNWPWI